MSQKFLQNHSKVLSNTLSQLDNFYQPIGSKINVYKFRKVSGSIYLTRYGEIPIDTKSETYNQNFQVYTGKEPIVVVWNNSFKAIGDKQTNTITKKYNVGDYETCYLSQAIDISNETTTKNLYGKDYTMTMLKYNISLQSNTWIPSEDDIRDYLYLIFDKKAKTYKWLEIVNIVPIYNEETNNFQYCEINFESINDKYTQTGKSILDFIQFGAIGEGYAFPKETHLANGDIVVEVDEKYIEDLGCNTLQLDFTSGAALSSMFVIGRRKSKKLENGDLQVDAPHLLWLYDTQQPQPSKFFYNQPNLNVYVGSKIQPTKEGIWKSYKDAYKGNNRIGEYNILNTKEVLTGLKHNQSTIRSTNPNLSKYTLSSREKFSVNFGKSFKIDANPYCLPTLSDDDVTLKLNYSDILNISSLQNFYSDVFNYDYNETKKWKLTDTLGIFGGIIKFVIGGLDVGWTSTENIGELQNDMTLLIPCISYEDGMLALDNNAPLPLDIFFDDKSQKVLPTSTNVLSSYRFRLTDRVIDTSQVRPGKPIGKGGNGIWDLKYVGQKKFENGEFINYDESPFRLNIKTTNATSPKNENFDWIIDYIDFKAVASCDYRISAYNIYNEPVYYSIAETNGKARGDIRIWGNATKFNYYDKFNTEGEVDYPNYNNPISPPKKEIIVEDNNSKINSSLFVELMKTTNNGLSNRTKFFKNYISINYTDWDLENWSNGNLKNKEPIPLPPGHPNYPGFSYLSFDLFNFISKDNVSFGLKYEINDLISTWPSNYKNEIYAKKNFNVSNVYEYKDEKQDFNNINEVVINFENGNTLKAFLVDSKKDYFFDFSNENNNYETNIDIRSTFTGRDFYNTIEGTKLHTLSFKEKDTNKTFDIFFKYKLEKLNLYIQLSEIEKKLTIKSEIELSNISINKVYSQKPFHYSGKDVIVDYKENIEEVNSGFYPSLYTSSNLYNSSSEDYDKFKQNFGGWYIETNKTWSALPTIGIVPKEFKIKSIELIKY